MKTRFKQPLGVLTLIAVASLAILLASSLSAGLSVQPAAASGLAANRVGSYFLYGSNMPWLNWNADFGGGKNGGGVSGNTAEAEAKLQAAQKAGMHMVRWWLFEGGSPQIQRDANGTPTGLNPNVYADMDSALALAAKYDIYYNFVLFSGTTDDSTTHQWWENSAQRQALVRVLTPLFQRYASNPRVHTWELVNEPEWQSRNGQTSVAGMLATGDALANAIHQNSNALVTVGHAQLQDMATWAGHPLDYYSPHYYDNFGTGSNDPFTNTATSPDGKPVVIGEFPADTGYNPDAQTRWQALYTKGYAGGWNWSISPEHTGDRIGTDLNAATAFSAGKSDIGPRATGSPTPVPPTATPVPPTPTAVPPTPVPPTPVPPTPTTVPPTPQPGQAAWTTRSSVSPTAAARGSSVKVTSQVTSNKAAKALVDVEIYDANWNKVYQRAWDNQSFTANQMRSFATTWTLPANLTPGTYTVMVGTFGPGWSATYSFNKTAATFTVR